MHSRKKLSALALSCAVLFSACGGGGGGGSGAERSDVTLDFDIQRAEATAFAGQQFGVNASDDATVEIRGKAHSDISGTVYAYIVDSDGVFREGAPLGFFLDATTGEFTVNLAIDAANLTPGTYDGELRVQLCRDAVCAQAYSVENDSLPYRVEVAPMMQIQVRVDGVERKRALRAGENDEEDYPKLVVSEGMTIELQSNVPVDWTVHRGGPGVPKLTMLEAATDRTFRARVLAGTSNASIYEFHIGAHAKAPTSEHGAMLPLEYEAPPDEPI